MYTKYTKQVFNGQGLTRKDDCFHGLLKDWTAAITFISDQFFLTHGLPVHLKVFQQAGVINKS